MHWRGKYGLTDQHKVPAIDLAALSLAFLWKTNPNIFERNAATAYTKHVEDQPNRLPYHRKHWQRQQTEGTQHQQAQPGRPVFGC